MFRFTTASLSALTLLGVAMMGPGAQAQSAEQAFHLRGEEVTLPFTLAKNIPFIEGEVNGVRGKLMFDTGARHALALNNRRVPLSGGTDAGSGLFGSGQTYAKLLHERVGPITVGDMTFESATQVQSQAAAQLERITPDFLGWIGYDFFDGYAIKLDYDALQVTFYKDGPDVAARYLEGETVVGVIPFETRLLPNNPMTSATLGSTSLELVFDTGQYGMLFAEQAAIDRLMAEGRVKPAADDRIDVSGLVIGDNALTLDINIDVMDRTFPPAAALDVHSPVVVSLGYAILSQYKTVWDYSAKRIYLLERGPSPAQSPDV